MTVAPEEMSGHNFRNIVYIKYSSDREKWPALFAFLYLTPKNCSQYK
jgi:hypothetical protein